VVVLGFSNFPVFHYRAISGLGASVACLAFAAILVNSTFCVVGLPCHPASKELMDVCCQDARIRKGSSLQPISHYYHHPVIESTLARYSSDPVRQEPTHSPTVRRAGQLPTGNQSNYSYRAEGGGKHSNSGYLCLGAHASLRLTAQVDGC
jgi:hypothetical protein